MYLKALEIQGFKSFPDKTRLSFEKDITVIVGPNGSGKSNISDALLWVMGEQKTRMLRGGKMEDVIFGGTEKRGAMGFAQVTLILDNTSRVLQFDADEVTIARRYYRSGESEYYINKDSVRLRDVTELLMDTGLGCDGYSIIGQGRISEIVSAKSTDRREIFEEAAGISRYRHRKDESERKLQRTEENLLRIGDKIAELEMQVGPLKEQSETAQKYLLLRDELRVQEVSLWMGNLDRLHDQSETLRRDYERSLVDCTAARSEQDRLYAESERVSERMRENDLEAEEMREQLRATEASAAEEESTAAVLKTNLANNAEAAERLQREIGEQSERVEGLNRQIDEHHARLDEIDAECASLQTEEETLRSRELDNTAGMDEQSLRLNRMLARENELNGTLAENRTALTLLEENRAALDERDAAMVEEVSFAEEKEQSAAAQLREIREKLNAAKEKEESLQNVISGHSMLMDGREKTLSEWKDKETKFTVELRSAESRITLLSDLEKDMEGFAKATKLVMREAERGTLRGVHGTIGQNIHTEDRYALAVETALGAHVGDVIVDTQSDGNAIFIFLKKNDGGRITLQPIDVIRPQTLRDIPRGEEGYVGICSELVRTDRQYENIISNLLGKTVVAETLGDAIRIARKHSNSFRIVTLDGQVINAGGSMTGGSAGRNSGILSRANELSRLREGKKSLEEKLADAVAKRQEAERVLESARYDLETAKEECAEARQERVRLEGTESNAALLRQTAEEALDALDEEKRSASHRKNELDTRMTELRNAASAAEKELAGLKQQMETETAGMESFEVKRRELEESFGVIREKRSSLEAEKNTVTLAVEQLRRLCEELAGESGQRRDAMVLVEQKSKELMQELERTNEHLAILHTKIDTEKNRIAELTSRKLELEGRRSTADKAAQEKNRELLDLERLSAQLEQKKLTADMEEKQIIDKLWDNYELSRTAAQNVRQPIESLAAAGKAVSELRRKISSLGTVNIGAIDEYKRVSERYEFLSGQHEDVMKSKTEILQIIADITKEMETIFRKEIREIDAAFRSIFVELFGGGHAELSLEDEEDVLNCGIDIRIQPPGKAVSNISLLSGGEKAFVAIALYFAIMRVRPTPFCVMDEIESALDEENVLRYAAYMRRMCEKTQFIAITHRRGTMESADQLYGVTMQEKGVSSVISMDMEEALQTIR